MLTLPTADGSGDASDQQFSYKFLRYKVIHPSFNFKSVSSVNIERNYQARHQLIEKAGRTQPLQTIFHSRTLLGFKTVFLNSAIRLVNALSVNVTIKIYGQQEPFTKILKPEGSFHAPIDQLNKQVQFFVNKQPMLKKSIPLNYFVQKMSSYWRYLVDADKNFNCVCKV